jgi:tRNA(adenine34) deaminase
MTSKLIADPDPTYDDMWMERALSVARAAGQKDEVPVAALIVQHGQLLTTAMNLRETLNDPTAHCEMIAIQRAASQLNRWRLTDCSLYVTLEPCLMCAGALVQARIGRVIFGTDDPKGGALGSLYQFHQDARLNHQLPVTPHVRPAECQSLLQEFFRNKRRIRKGLVKL